MAPGALSGLLRNALALAVSTLLAVGALEVAVRAFDLFSDARAAAPAPGAPEGEKPGAYRSLFKTQVHPFRGWSFRPGTDISEGLALLSQRRGRGEGPSAWALERSRVNQFGFFSAIEDYRTLEEERYVVAVFGGSVAGAVVTSGGPALVAALESRFPELAGRVVVVSLAAPAYKQPQQLIVLMEMALLGVPLDLVVNLDGFNEADAGRRDAREGFHPLYPSRRQYELSVGLAERVPSDEAILGAAAVLTEKRAEREILDWSADSGLARSSQLVRAAAGALALRHRARAHTLEALLQASVARDRRGASGGLLDAPCLGPDGDCRALVAELWANASLLMHAVAREMGAEYVHVLQPNQYVEGSKPLSDEERRLAWTPESEKARNAREGYPFLQERGAFLRGRGVAFHDLTGLFAETPESVYLDPCCHYNARGNARVAEAIAGRVLGPRSAESPGIPQL